MWDSIARHIQATTGKPFRISERVPVGGGCINRAFRISDAQKVYFVKVNQASKASMFEA
jgi:fructosamine-3-kinase